MRKFVDFYSDDYIWCKNRRAEAKEQGNKELVNYYTKRIKNDLKWLRRHGYR